MNRDNLEPTFLDRPQTVAHLIIKCLHQRGVRRIYGLTGGHIKPLWDEAHIAGIDIISVRHEAAAVHMAQAHADLTGELAIATVTTGPGFTNAFSGIVAADIARSPVLILVGLPPTPQLGMRSLEDLDHVSISRPITRYANTIGKSYHVLWKLDDAIAAALGEDGRQGAAMLDIPIDILRTVVPENFQDSRLLAPRPCQHFLPDPKHVEDAAEILRQSQRPLVISGRGAFGAGNKLRHFLQESGAMYLDTKSSRGLISIDHENYMSAVRARAMAECDLIVTLGAQLDFELGYGSTALFAAKPKLVRIGRSSDELHETRRADVAIRGDVAQCLKALMTAGVRSKSLDEDWFSTLRAANNEKQNALAEKCAIQPTVNGRLHPLRLLSVVNQFIDENTIVIVDGGDIFSFARVALETPCYMDTGPFGCLGVGVPFAVAAASLFPERRVLAVIGDGAFGFNAMELETAARIGAKAVFVIVNNGAWNIERCDQIFNYGGRIVGTEIPGCRYDLLAQSLGAHGEHVETIEELPGALERAIENGPSVVDVAVTRDAISPDFKSGLAELPEYQALRTWNDAEEMKLKN